MIPENRHELLLRIPLAVVFLWFGIDKFFNLGYWTMWVPQPIHVGLERILQTEIFPTFIHGVALFEISVGAALILGLLVKQIAAAASVFLLIIILASGANPATIRDIGLLGAMIYLAAGKRSGSEWIRSLAFVKKMVIAIALVSFIVGASVVLSSTPMTPVQAEQSTFPPNALAGEHTINQQPKLDVKERMVFLYPTEGAATTEKKIQLKLRVPFDFDNVAFSHIHLKLDNMVFDAVYLAQAGEVVREITVSPGTHTLSAYAAYIDHTEVSGHDTSVTFVVAK